MTFRLTLALALVVAIITAPATFAQACAERGAAVERLSGLYGEALVGLGLQSETVVVEVWVAPDGASWTILRTFPSGVSCVLASGSYWSGDVDPPDAGGVDG